jgi:hypothetical protein
MASSDYFSSSVKRILANTFIRFPEKIFFLKTISNTTIIAKTPAEIRKPCSRLPVLPPYQKLNENIKKMKAAKEVIITDTTVSR